MATRETVLLKWALIFFFFIIIIIAGVFGFTGGATGLAGVAKIPSGSPPCCSSGSV